MKSRILYFVGGLLLATSLYFVYLNFSGKERTSYYPNGQVMQIAPVENGVVNGIVKDYFENGNLKSEIEFRNGKESGLGKFYYESGELNQVRKFKLGLDEDSARIYYKSGALKELSFYVNGAKEGTVLAYLENGKLNASGNCTKDRKHGDWSFYDSLGNVRRTVTYRNDTIVSIRENLLYKNLLDGYTIRLPGYFSKIPRSNGIIQFGGKFQDWGVVSLSILCKPFTSPTLTSEVNRELESSRASVSVLQIISRKASENRELVEIQGKHKPERNSDRFYAKLLLVNFNSRFYIFSAYIPPKMDSTFKKVKLQIDSMFQNIKFEHPEVIVE